MAYALRFSVATFVAVSLLCGPVIAQDKSAVPADGFLNNYIRDGLNILGALGVVVTAVGFLVGIWALLLAKQQMKQTTDAATAATKAAIAAHEENRRLYNRFVIGNMVQMLDGACVYILKEDWFLAAIRVG